jgi:chromosome partitioning protein
MEHSVQTITLASRKGGAGKTTLATHLAVEAERLDGPVAMIDLDSMQSLTKWWDVREAQTPAFVRHADLAATLTQLRGLGYKTVIIDTPPSIDPLVAEAIRLSDLVIIPVQPSPNDLRAIGVTIRLVEDAGKPMQFVVTRTKHRARANQQAVELLQTHGPVCKQFLTDREDYKRAMSVGQTAPEMEPKGPTPTEISAIWSGAKARMGKVAVV